MIIITKYYFLQRVFFMKIMIILNNFFHNNRFIQVSSNQMSSLDQSMMDILVGLHEYNQLLSTRDSYRIQTVKLQQKTKYCEHLEREYSNLFEQKKELERDVKKISAVSINLSSKMLESEQNYLKLIKSMENEIATLNSKNQSLAQQLILLKESEKAHQQLLRELEQFSFPDISQDSVQAEDTGQNNSGNSGQNNTDKIKISHQQVQQLFSTQPEKRQQQKKRMPKELFFSSSQSSIYSRRIADKIRKLVTELQATRKQLAQKSKLNDQLRESSRSRQSTSSEISLPNTTYEDKYKKLKFVHQSTKLQLQSSKQELRKLKVLCISANINKS